MSRINLLRTTHYQSNEKKLTKFEKDQNAVDRLLKLVEFIKQMDLDEFSQFLDGLGIDQKKLI